MIKTFKGLRILSNGKLFIKRIARNKFILGNKKGFKIATEKQAMNFYKLNFK